MFVASPLILRPITDQQTAATAGVNKAVELIFKQLTTHLKYLVNKIWLFLPVSEYERG